MSVKNPIRDLKDSYYLSVKVVIVVVVVVVVVHKSHQEARCPMVR